MALSEDRPRPNWRVAGMILKVAFCASMAVLAADSLPLDSIAEKGGVWALVGMLLWWILGVLSKKMDSLSASIDKLADRIEDHNRDER